MPGVGCDGCVVLLSALNADTVAYMPAYPPLVMQRGAGLRGALCTLVVGAVGELVLVWGNSRLVSVAGDEAVDDADVEPVLLPHPARNTAVRATANRFCTDPPVDRRSSRRRVSRRQPPYIPGSGPISRTYSAVQSEAMRFCMLR